MSDTVNKCFEKNPNVQEEKVEDTVEQTILMRLKNFFDLHKKLDYDHLNDFLISLDMSHVFGSNEERDFIWTIFTRIANEEGKENAEKEVDYEVCKKGMLELLNAEGGDEEGNESHDNPLFNPEMEKNNLKSPSSSKSLRISLRESIQNKDKKLDELVTVMQMKHTPDKIPHYNTPYTEIDLTSENKNNDNIGVDSTLGKKKKPLHERKITKIFTEINIEKLQQLRKAFSLLDLRNKNCVYISELQEVVRKYKFIKLTQEELINFLSLISDDLIGGKDNKENGNVLKLSIDFELYSRAMCAIEQQLLQVNTDTFERNDSYEINDNYEEMIENLHNSESENIDYIMVLADILRSIEFRINDSIVENYEKIIKKNYQGSETEEQVLEQIKEGRDYLKSKMRDMEVFLKEISLASVQSQNKLAFLKVLVEKLETNLKHSEEDFRNLFQKFNTQQPVEISDETERLIEENLYLNEQKEQKNEQIEILQKETEGKDEIIFNLQLKVDKSDAEVKNLQNCYSQLIRDYDALKKNYDTLLNDIYEKIKKEEEKGNTNDEKDTNKETNYSSLAKTSTSSFSNVKSASERETIHKLREKLVISEENKKVFDMNYEQLILYTLNIDSMNKQLEDKNSYNEKRIREIENELKEITKTNSETSKTLHMVKSENSRLQNKISDLNKEIEINQVFRPSKVLGGRISRMSNINDRKSNLSNFPQQKPANRFKNIEKVFAVKEEESVKSEAVEVGDTARISQMTIGDADSFQFGGGRQQKKLETVQSVESEYMPDKSNYANNFEPSSLSNTNQIFFSQKDSFSYTNDKFLFDEKQKSNFNIDNTNQTMDITNSQAQFSFKIDKSQNNNNKEVIVDSLDEENPFSQKEENKPQEKQDANTSVDLNVIARHSPFDIDINLHKREELKKITKDKESQLVSSINNVNIRKLNRVPSKIAEGDEILEEDENGEIIGTATRLSERLSNRLSTNNNRNSNSEKDSGNNNASAEDQKKGGHNRVDTIEDLGLIFNKDSQYMCYDFLTLRKTEAILKMFEDNHEDVSSYEMFSDNIYLIDENNKKSKKYLFITSNYVYILRPYDLSQKTRISLKNLEKLTISNKNCNLIAFHFREGDDLLLEILRRMELLYFFRDLYRMKRYGKLKFKYSDNFKIKRNNAYSNIIVDQANNFFIAPNFDGAQKLGYLSKLTGTFFSKFTEKLVVLTNVGLLYFDDPNKPPKKLIPIIGSDIQRVDEKKYKKKHCFEIKTLNGESYVFASNSNEEMESWILEFKSFRKNYEKKIKNIDSKK